MSGLLSALHEAAKSRPGLVSALLAGIGFFVFHHVEDISRFPHDSEVYWHLAQCAGHGTFPVSRRGYFFPALLAPFRLLFDADARAGLLAFRLGTSALYAFGTCVILPALFSHLTRRAVPFHRRLVVPALLLVLFPGLVLYPLSDLPALLLLSGSAWCALRAQPAGGAHGLALAALSGFLAYGAYNCRTVYLFSFLLGGIGTAVVPAGGWRMRIRGGMAAAFLSGAAFAGLPQARINLAHRGDPLPTVSTAKDGGRSLFIRQLLWGVTIQKYETSIEPNRSTPDLRYLDAAGSRFFADNKFDASTTTFGQYLVAMARDPLFFTGLLGRHFVNGLDVRDGEVYLTSPSSERHALALFNLLVVSAGCLALFRCGGPGGTAGDPAAGFWIFVLVLPVCVALPGAVETRFFLPLHVLLYAALAYAMNVHDLLPLASRRWLTFVLGGALAAGVFFGITFNTMSSLEHPPEAEAPH